MIIHRILNNNVVLTKDEHGRERVVSGRGIAYKKHVGDVISANAINKVFVAEDPGEQQKLISLLSEIPPEHIAVADKIVTMVRRELGAETSDSLYINLSDHIHTAVRRYLDGVMVTNTLLWDIKRYYEREYRLGLKALDIIEAGLHVRLPDDEASFIALHIVNAEMDEDNMAQAYQVMQIVREVCQLVQYHFSVMFDQSNSDYYRFITHLRFLARRLLDSSAKRPNQDDGLWQVLAQTYPEAWHCAERVADFLRKRYAYDLSNDERVYLALHIEKAVKRNTHTAH